MNAIYERQKAVSSRDSPKATAEGEALERPEHERACGQELARKGPIAEIL